MFQKKKIFLLLGILVFILGAVFLLLKKQDSFRYNMKTFFYDENTLAVLKTLPSSQQKMPPDYTGTLKLTAKPQSQIMSSGILCLEHAAEIKKIDLYMPQMGHGSTPPVVTPQKDSHDTTNPSSQKCFELSSLQFFMPGVWQVRVFYEKNILGIFELSLEE